MVNRTLGNRYQITEKIGMGGMAEVYKATDSTLGRTVAVKVMLPQYASDPNFAARFRQEAQAAANLSSPYIVNIYDWGRDGDSYYIVMEYVRGTDRHPATWQHPSAQGSGDRLAGMLRALRRARLRHHPSRHQVGEHHGAGRR